MMKIILALMALFFCVIATAQIDWKKVAINEKVVIAFPGEPVQKTMAKGMQSWVFDQPDSTATFIVSLTDFSITSGLDSASLDREMKKEETWQQAKKGFVESLGKNARLLNDEMITINQTRVLKMTVEKKNTKGILNIYSVLVFVQATNSLNIIFTNRGGKADEKMKVVFFESLEIND